MSKLAILTDNSVQGLRLERRASREAQDAPGRGLGREAVAGGGVALPHQHYYFVPHKGEYMRYGRPTSDPKDEVTRVRLNQEMRRWLFRKSEIEQKSVSQVIRDIIAENMKAR